MTTALQIALALATLAFALSAVVLVWLLAQWRRDQRWERAHEREAAIQERLAARNGRPHSEAVIQGATRRRRDP